MNVLDLFSGIGGFSFGLERAGCTTKYFCEIDLYCRRVLAKHWPDVPCFSDVRTLRGTDVEGINLICGGFPCQDISLAGKGAGLSGERSGLWYEYARIIEEVRPSYVLIENVSALRSRGLDQVLGALAALGYDAEWHCIPACAVGAPHQRDRVWIVAYSRCQRRERWGGKCGGAKTAGTRDWLARSGQDPEHVAYSRGARRGAGGESFGQREETAYRGVEMADAARVQSGRQEPRPIGERAWKGGESIDGAHTDALGQQEQRQPLTHDAGREFCGIGLEYPRWWESEPNVGRVAHGVPARVDRLRGLGNAIVPQIAEILGRAILAHAQSVRLNEEVFS